ncbi:glycosyl hydrolase [Haloarchaeobius sp. HME9146]|uniref:glycosyl hydrolase n=1 Tax=Haloarchaeobius sp. HME9146 TaxID=2978732 RepID=UPI0021C2223F|nr:glycosyl hydrolase [Haloarchaeobius sp. HME9146]MCT9098282.1 glycosyl hydrolase [Haloarchaeobius sp. HME9146]
MGRDTGFLLDGDTELSRRRCLAGIGAIGSVGLAGCSSQSDGTETTTTGSKPTSTPTATATATETAEATANVVSVGSGSYTTTLPSGEEEPPEQVYATDDVSAPYPTNDWWSNLLRGQYGEAMWAHPLVGTPTSSGLGISHPTEWNFTQVNGDKNRGNIAEMDPSADLTLSTTGASFLDARCAGYGDWHVDVRWGAGDASTPTLDATMAQGSPFVFAEVDGADAKLSFSATPDVWADQGNVIGVTVNGHHYGVFAPSGATWSGIGSPTLTSSLAGASYLTIGVLPEATTAALSRYESYAYNTITGTTVSWTYDEASATVQTTHTFETTARAESSTTGTIAALYPHQYKHSDATLDGDTFVSPRGTMKTTTGSAFETQLDLPPIVPFMPDVGEYDESRLASYVDDVEAEPELIRFGPEQPGDGTYWTGKNYERLYQLRPIAEQVGDTTAADAFLGAMQDELETWLDATVSGSSDSEDVFYYNETWGTLIGYNDSFGSGPELNDHHFHYGQYVKAAAEIARTNPTWADDSNWGGMVDLLIRDYANPSRSDAKFPFLRNFSPYEGHSWAAGNPAFYLGNNQESSSEAVNAYAAVLMYGEYIGDTELRDTGAYLLAHETTAVDEYWYDVDEENHPADWDYGFAGMVWGGGYKYDTWWTDDVEAIHGINVLPVGGHSLSLGRDRDAAESTYQELVAANGGDDFDYWPDILWSYRAFSDPADALRLFEAEASSYPVEFGESKAHTYRWLTAMDGLGAVDASVTADTPLAAVFDDGTTRTYVAYNADDTSTTVSFSDGTSLSVPANDLATTTASSNSGDGGADDSTTPSVDSVSTSTSSNGPWTDVTVDWTVSDATADLQSVTVELRDDSGSTLDSATISVSGDSASGTTVLETKNTPETVAVSATDQAGQETTTTTTL